MARYPSALTALFTLFLALLFPALTLAQAAAAVAPVAATTVEPAVAVATTAPTVAVTTEPTVAVTTEPTVAATTESTSSTATPVAAPAAAGVGGVAVGGAAGVPVSPTQYPTTAMVPKIVTLTGADGVIKVTSSDVLFTQTFVTTALEAWHFLTPKVGSVGLGTLTG